MTIRELLKKHNIQHGIETDQINIEEFIAELYRYLLYDRAVEFEDNRVYDPVRVLNAVRRLFDA